jgi:hypothetical protein
MEIERGTTRSHVVENSLWQRLCTCRKTDYSVMSSQCIASNDISTKAEETLLAGCELTFRKLECSLRRSAKPSVRNRQHPALPSTKHGSVADRHQMCR